MAFSLNDSRSRAVPLALTAAFVLALMSAFVVAARAQQAPTTAQPSANEIALAREQSRIGVAAARLQRWTEAREAFERSFRLYPRTLTLLNLAGAQVESGQLVAGAESYRRFLQQATTGPAAAQRDAAQHALVDAEARIPRLRLAAPGLTEGDQLLLDGQVVSHAALGAQLPVDPGPHVVAVTRNGSDIAHASFSVEPRGTREVSLTVPPLPPIVVTTTRGRETGTNPLDAAGRVPGGSVVRRPDLVLRDDQGLPPPPRTPSRSLVAPVLATVASILVVGGGIVGGYFLWRTAEPVPFAGNTTPPTAVIP